jgi:hypothetical protein
MVFGTLARGLQPWPPVVPPSLAAIGDVRMFSFRTLVVACQVATLWITWPLWQVRDSPPMLPAFPLPAFDLGWLLIFSLLLVLVAPVPGITLQTILLLYAVLIDQTRLQPGVVSLLFLLWGTVPNPTAQGFARAHLLTLWLFAGFHKLLSPAFLNDTAPRLLTGFPLDLPQWLITHGGYVIAFAELGTGLLALSMRTRKAAALMAFGLHIAILLNLSQLGINRNDAVWPWNIALAFAGFALIAPWKESLLSSIAMCHALARPLLVCLLVAPLGFYLGLMDAYLAHNLYSANTPQATVMCRDECLPHQNPNAIWEAFRVPPPPEQRLFEQYFVLTCRPGDQLLIRDSRLWFTGHDLISRRVRCPTTH